MADRKARLAALAAKAGRSKKSNDADEPPQQQLQDDSVAALQDTPSDELVIQQTEEIIEEPAPKRTKTEEKKSALEQAVEQAQLEASLVVTRGDVSRMGPKKVNADLKRDIQDKMDKLERRTQRAIVSLLKERLEREAAQDVPDLD